VPAALSPKALSMSFQLQVCPSPAEARSSVKVLLEAMNKHCLLANQTPWPESASDRRLSAKLVTKSDDRERQVVSAMDPYGVLSDF
jgi:hypothetical protein